MIALKKTKLVYVDQIFGCILMYSQQNFNSGDEPFKLEVGGFVCVCICEVLAHLLLHFSFFSPS